MNEQEVEKLLKKISTQKMYGEIDKAIANLHILQNEFPNEKKYLALLASAYMEADSDNAAVEYCDKATMIDPDYPQAFELKGLLAEKAGNQIQAEDFYKKSIHKDIMFRGGHLRLLLLYYVENRFEEAVKEGEFLLSNFDKGRESYTSDEKRSVAVNWLTMVYGKTISALIKLERYEESIRFINESVAFRQGYIKDEYHFHDEDQMLFKLYFLTKDEPKMVEYKNKWLSFYNVPEHRVNSMQKDVEQGFIEEINPENYIV